MRTSSAPRPIREADGRGRHTTTASQLVVLPGGALLIDTPGREGARPLGRRGRASSQVFADIEELAPSLSVRRLRAPDRARLRRARRGRTTARLASWRKLRRELARTSGERTARDQAEARRRWKVIPKAKRAHRPRP